MKKVVLRLMILLVCFLFLGLEKAQAQEGTIFEFEVLKSSRGVFEVSFRFNDADQVNIIQMELIEEEDNMGTFEAILNRKADNNYYLFYNNEERLVYLDNLKIVIKNEAGRAKPKTQALEVRLLDKDFKVIDSYRKEITQ